MRRRADVWRVPYPVYPEIGFHLLRNVRNMNSLSVPNLRFADREESITWRKQFKKVWNARHLSEYAKLSHMAQFWLSHDQGLPTQHECRQRIIDIARRGRRYQHVAETLAVASQLLPISAILSLESEANERMEIEESINSSVETAMIVINAEPKMEGSLLQTCFGLPRLIEGTSSPCSTCAHRSACALAAKSLERHG